MPAIVAAVGGSSAAIARDRPPAEWSQVALDDLHFVRAALRENHPGPVDQENPAFRDWFARGFDESLAMARQARSYAGYYFAIQHYLVGFQDSHLGALGDDRMAPDVHLKREWPGFVVTLDQGKFRAAESSPDGPPAGAALTGCDGRSADQLAEEILKPFLPLWSLRGARFQNAPFLLVDEGNPFLKRPVQCSWQVGKSVRTMPLKWTPIDNSALAPKVAAAEHQIHATTGIRPFGKNGWWITLASFNANADADSKPLLELIDTLTKRAGAFRNADVLVIDARGNTGGSSEFGRRIAAALWGKPFVDTAPGSTAIDWRLSQLNLRQLERSNLPAMEKNFGKDDPKTRALAKFIEGYKAAMKRGDLFYREPFDRAPARAQAILAHAKIFLLTDGWCHSACLDFVDLALAAPGVTQVGAETSADTVYIDNTGVLLPSGEGVLGWSMKVHRGRPRGHNQSYVPKYVYPGPITDTPGLERWIAGLAQHSR